MMGGTGGYLVGYVLAVLALGALTRRGWDRARGKMALAMLLGNVLIYVPGLIWLTVLYGVDAPILAWGLTPFLLGDVVKLALAALLLPALWILVGRARR
jgi:biotin transport system substrate-specific component